jgi:RHS repeat-associated protein
MPVDSMPKPGTLWLPPRQWDTAAFGYDGNGNTIWDTARTYAWDGRNQLASIAGAGATASFEYDVFGRRVSRTLAGTTTASVYDGANAAVEAVGGTPTTTFLTGGVDEVFRRTDAAGARHPLSDALGSTVALTDGGGAVPTSYTYEAFGTSTVIGAASDNAAQFAGRENDGTGLYYYRARYYSPTSGRFLSEDPLEFGAGDSNLYAYVGNDPANVTDPSGEIAPWLAACGMGAAFDVGAGAIGDYFGSMAGRKDSSTWSTMGTRAAKGCASGLVGFGVGKALGYVAGELIASARAARQSAELRRLLTGWLGPGFEKVENGSDLMVRSLDKTRQIRFDLTNPHGLDPHVNIETWALRNLYPGDKRMIRLTNSHVYPKR